MIYKKKFRFLVLAGLMSVICTNLFARQFPSDTVRIACVGNSITQGARLADPAHDSYPAILQKKFDRSRVAVKNFGLGGATIIRFGRTNIWRKLDSIRSYLPQIVILKIGTNETVSTRVHHWEHINDFEKDYYDFLAQLKSLPSHPIIYICSPIDMALKTDSLSKERLQDLTERRPRLWNLRKRIKRIARVSNVHFIDLTPKFKGKPELFTPGDGVHPNKAGYNFLAELIFKKIKNSVNQQMR